MATAEPVAAACRGSRAAPQAPQLEVDLGNSSMRGRLVAFIALHCTWRAGLRSRQVCGCSAGPQAHCAALALPKRPLKGRLLRPLQSCAEEWHCRLALLLRAAHTRYRLYSRG